MYLKYLDPIFFKQLFRHTVKKLSSSSKSILILRKMSQKCAIHKYRYARIENSQGICIQLNTR